jgi:hypothetical protein
MTAAARAHVATEATADPDAIAALTERRTLEAATIKFLRALYCEALGPAATARFKAARINNRFLRLLDGETQAAGTVVFQDPIDRVGMLAGRAFGINPERLFTSDRSTRVVRSRQVAMFLASRVLSWSFLAIGHRFHKDHSTVCTSVHLIEEMMTSDDGLCGVVDELREEITPTKTTTQTGDLETPPLKGGPDAQCGR